MGWSATTGATFCLTSDRRHPSSGKRMGLCQVASLDFADSVIAIHDFHNLNLDTVVVQREGVTLVKPVWVRRILEKHIIATVRNPDRLSAIRRNEKVPALASGTEANPNREVIRIPNAHFHSPAKLARILWPIARFCD